MDGGRKTGPLKRTCVELTKLNIREFDLNEEKKKKICGEVAYILAMNYGSILSSETS